MSSAGIIGALVGFGLIVGGCVTGARVSVVGVNDGDIVGAVGFQNKNMSISDNRNTSNRNISNMRTFSVGESVGSLLGTGVGLTVISGSTNNLQFNQISFLFRVIGCNSSKRLLCLTHQQHCNQYLLFLVQYRCCQM